MNWVSDIFYVTNFKTIHTGQIYGKGCDSDIKKEPQIIEIYKIIDNTDDKEKLIAKLHYLKNIPEFGGKWDFIKSIKKKLFESGTGKNNEPLTSGFSAVVGTSLCSPLTSFADI